MRHRLLLGYEVPDHYSPFAVADAPKSRVLFQFEANEGVWNGSDRAKQTKSLMRLSEEIKNQTGVGEPSEEENILSIGETPHPAAHTWHGITHEKLW